MSIFGFLKKKKEINEKEIVSKDELSEWLLTKKRQHQEKEKEFFNLVKEIISQLVSELESEISILEDFNFESKKVDLRIKLIVKENLRNYIGYMEKMIVRLNEIDKRENLVEKINVIFEDFNKKTRINYEKVTFIIGKEMRATKESIKKFFKDLELILKSNKEIFKEFGIVKSVEGEIEKLGEIEENKSEVSQILKESFEKINDLKKSLENKENEIKEIKKSARFLEEIKKKDKFDLKNKALQGIVRELKDAIDFKTLSNFYHKFENDMNLVKQYKDDFQQILERDGIQKLESLLAESKLINENILELINKIKRVVAEIEGIIFEDMGIHFLEKSVERVKSEINTNDSEIKIEEKRIKNIEEHLNKVVGAINELLSKIDVEFLEK